MMKPTLRDDFRYLLVQCEGTTDIKRSVSQELEKYLGILGLTQTGAKVVALEDGKAIVRVVRGTEDLVCSAFALVNKRDGESRRMRVLRISGTIRALCKKESIKRVKRLDNHPKGKRTK